jgi:hypothetical protein
LPEDVVRARGPAGVRIDLARLAAIARFFPAFRARVAIFHILNETLANPGACV